MTTGPLAGRTVIELAGLGPAPFCGMLLADMGARVIRVDRPGAEARPDVAGRGKTSIAVNLKHPDGVATVLDLCAKADALIEGFRPGVTERLGIGPEPCRAANPKLVYGRMTGWGQDGPLAQAAGHDINYIALTGALHAIGPTGGKPVPPINLIGDFGGGGMLLAFGVLCALLEAEASGQGQVVDAAMVDGTNALLAMCFTQQAQGRFNEDPGAGPLSGAAHYYDTYETSDGRWVALGSIEPQFYAALLDALDLADDPDFAHQRDPERWPELTERLAAVFRTRTRDEWCERMEGTDICFAPVLSLSEAPDHPHNVARSAHLTRDGMVQPAPAPRFDRTPGAVDGPAPAPGADTTAVLAGIGYDQARIDRLVADGAVHQA